MATEQVPISALSPQQLLELRQSLEQEVQGMAQNGLTLQSTAAKFGAAGQAVEYLQDQKQGGWGTQAGAPCRRPRLLHSLPCCCCCCCCGAGSGGYCCGRCRSLHGTDVPSIT